jgi:hypothetical protein
MSMDWSFFFFWHDNEYEVIFKVYICDTNSDRIIRYILGVCGVAVKYCVEGTGQIVFVGVFDWMNILRRTDLLQHDYTSRINYIPLTCNSCVLAILDYHFYIIHRCFNFAISG